MVNLFPLVSFFAFAYGTVFVGQLCALLLQACLRGKARRALSATESAWCLSLVPLALLLLPVLSFVAPEVINPAAELALHRVWHTWTDALSRSAWGHGALHAANVLFLLFVFSRVVVAVYAIASQRGLTVALHRAHPVRVNDGAVPFYTLPSLRLVCFTVGWLRPTIYVSSALLERMTPAEQAAMLAHEAAHVRRLDGLVGMAFKLFYTLFPLPGARLLCAEWEQATERACDAEAARRVGSACDVAQALLCAARLVVSSSQPVRGEVAPLAAHFVSTRDDIEGRVHALLLLEPDDSAKTVKLASHNRFALALLTSLYFFLLLMAEGFVRHLVELFAHH